MGIKTAPTLYWLLLVKLHYLLSIALFLSTGDLHVFTVYCILHCVYYVNAEGCFALSIVGYCDLHLLYASRYVRKEISFSCIHVYGRQYIFWLDL